MEEKYDVPPMVPSMYPMPEYRPSTPQSATQPEMIETVKTYVRTPNPGGGKRREKKRRKGVSVPACVCVALKEICKNIPE